MSESALTASSDRTDSTPFSKPTKLTRSRRMRPPDLKIRTNVEARAPLRADKVGKSGRRESHFGFGRFFGRHKLVAETETMRTTAPEITESKDTEEIVDTIGGTRYDLQLPGAQPEILDVPVSEFDAKSRPKTAATRPPTAVATTASPTMPHHVKSRRGSIATTAWDPVPLFQAWPQAVRTATLPACLQADSLLRMHNKKEMLPTINQLDLGDDKDVFVAMAKKRHRSSSSSKLDWTTKVFILVTSGYLLQYPGDGPHDSLPEKMVQLTKDSAAFASDVIPGKHWVLQVSSVFEDGAIISQDTRSLLGKLGLREKERRQASDILMIFENAADMDSWMTLLRREIEVLGGRAPLTETGTPRLDDEQAPADALPMSPSGRTVVVRDPNFGQKRSLSEMRWDSAVTFDSPGLHTEATFNELRPDHSFDDNSTTNSFVSQDGRQLDGLRDSGNRYSFMSVGRTIVTSDSSACNSPIRDSFGSSSQDGHPSEDITPLADELDKMHMRPNAAEIENRRQSYRSSHILFEPNVHHQTHRQHSSLSVVQEPPNFSLPNATARRRAASNATADPVHTMSAPGRPARRARRPPPPTLGFTRPLSVVADSPSPSMSSPPADTYNKTYNNIGFSDDRPESLSFFNNWATEDGSKPEYDLSSRASSQQSNTTSFQVSNHASPRKFASLSTLRPADQTPLWDDPHLTPPIPEVSPLRQQLPHSANDIPRSMSDMPEIPNLISLGPPRSRSPIQRAMAAQKRASMGNLKTSSRRASVSVFANNTSHRPTQSDHFPSSFVASIPPMPTAASHRGSRLSVPSSVFSGHKRSGSNSSSHSFKPLGNRRSMPHIPAQQSTSPPFVNSPPPAPPPNKALPPIPTGKSQRRSGSTPPASMRVRSHGSMVNLAGREF